MDVACRLAAERGSRIVALNVLEVPLDQPSRRSSPSSSGRRTASSTRPPRSGTRGTACVLTRLERARSAGPAVVAEADARGAEIIVLGAPRRRLTAAQAAVLGKTVDYILRHATCRVLVTAWRAA